MFAKRYLVAAGAAALAFGFAGTAANAAGLFTLQSKTFADGKMMPKKVANSHAIMATNPNCVGENVSPELHWSNVPDGTKSLVLLMFDPEGRAPFGVSHWVAYGIDPAKTTGFAEGSRQQGFGSICRRQKPDGGRALFRALHAARPDAAPLHVHSYRDRFCAERIAARSDPRGLDGQVRGAAVAAREGRNRPHRAVRQSVA